LSAWLPRVRREAILSHEIVPMTPTTVTDPETLREQFAEIRRRGFATSYAERTPGIRSVAAPLFDHTGAVTACLSVSGPEMRMSPDRMQGLGLLVQRGAWTVSEALGATPAVVRAHDAELEAEIHG
jgi:IclR family transcriptional regulator, acetate operon repressor